MERLKKDAVRGMLVRRQEDVKAVARSRKDAIDTCTNAPDRRTRALAMAGMWEFTPFKKKMDKEIDTMVDIMRAGEKPFEFSLKITRFSLALYFLDKLEGMLDVVEERKNAALTVQFNAARRAVRKILSDTYFSKSRNQILEDYHQGEYEIAACAEACSVTLLNLDDAVKQYQPKLAEIADDKVVNAKHDPPNLYIPI